MRLWGNSTMEYDSFFDHREHAIADLSPISRNQMAPLPNPYHILRTMLTLNFRPADAALDQREAAIATYFTLNKIVGVITKAARERMPDPRVPVYGIKSSYGSTEIEVFPNPARPDRLQATLVREALLGIMIYCAEEGWGQRTIEIHHDVLGYIGDIDFRRLLAKTARVQGSRR